MNNKNQVAKLLISVYFILLQVSGALCRGQPRIVGGSPTTIVNAPFLVQVVYDRECQCGGTLLSENFVVTAAHCVENKPLERLTIVGGTTRLTEKGIRSKVSKILVPKNFDNSTNHMDVAGIKLKTPMKGPSIQPIGLCKTGWKEGDQVQLYGWGLKSENKKFSPDQMRTVTIDVINKNLCTNMYLSQEMTITDTMFCAATPGKDACTGDSGGPAIINGQLCGIISWGLGCGRKDSPGVYTDVTKVSPFIINAMQQ